MSSSSSVIRVFNGCRALLAQAKSSTPKSSSAAVAKPKSKPRAPSPAKSAPPTKAKTKKPISAETKAARVAAITKSLPVSSALRSFLGASEISRSDAVKNVWDYVKTNNLQNPANKKEILCDAKLKTIFDGKEKVGILEVPKLLSSHFVKA